jgi:nicotinamide phosphoribosyltransferase
MAGIEASLISASGHLLSFSGTDTIPAISLLEKYYNAILTRN